MAGAMRKMGEYLGLVEQADYDEYDDEPSVVVPVPREVEGRPVKQVTARGPVSHIDEHRRSRPMAAPSALSRIETVTLEPRYDLRPRESRVRPLADGWALLRFGRSARSRSIRAETPAPAS